jgi:hypothetical protein
MKDIDSDFNIYYCKADTSIGEKTLERLQGEGVDNHSLVADPLFVDAKNGDFRLKPRSPALKMGFVPIDFSQVGLRNEN